MDKTNYSVARVETYTRKLTIYYYW